MPDQAEVLRALFRDRAMCCEAFPRPPKVYTLAVTSGKGGVGKTSIAVNLALLLARGGRQVRLVDADFGLSNAEVLLGIAPKHGLADVLRGEVSADEAWVTAPGGIKLLSSGSGLADMANMDAETGVRLIGHVLSAASDGDVVIIDTAPGIDASVVSVLGSADEVMLVTTPEPTSITDTYASIKVLCSVCPDADMTLVANCCSSPAQASAVANGLGDICARFLGTSFERHEYLPKDAEVGRAIQRQSPLVIAASHAPAASWLRRIAIKLDNRIRKRQSTCDAACASSEQLLEV